MVWQFVKLAYIFQPCICNTWSYCAKLFT